MSAELFRNQSRDSHSHTSTSGLLTVVDSRIPVPSPGAFRRCQSLRLRGERGERIDRLERCCQRSSAAAGRHLNYNNHHNPPPPGHTAAPAAGGSASARPRIATTDPHGGLRVPADHREREQTQINGNRIRSLSLSLSSPRLTSIATSRITVPISTGQGGGGAAGASPCTPPTSPYAHEHDDDLDSLRSYASVASTASCDHPFVAHNGTTFSGRRMKYVVHCSSHAGQTGDEYLTPTQRAQKQIKRLKFLLHQAKQDIEQKDSDIFRLTKEVVELRVYKTLNSPEDKSNSSEAVTVRENATDDMKTPDSPTCTDFTDDPKTPFDKSVVDMQSSFADSGHFEDLNTSKDSVLVATADKAVLARLGADEDVVLLYERKLEDLVRTHAGAEQDLKQRHNDKVDELLQRLSDVNLRYCQLVPNYEQARDKIQELEKQLDEVNKQLQEQEEKNKQLYLQMYNKGVEAAKLEQKEQVMALAQKNPCRVSVSELLQQLQVTQTELENIKDTEFMAEHSPQAQSLLSAKEAVSLWVLGARKAMYRRLVELKNSKSEMDPEITLQFLKSAIYYFLTDRENHQGHLRAIQSILGFTPSEITNIDKARTS